MNLKGLFIITACIISIQARSQDWKPQFDKLIAEAQEKDIFSGNVLIVKDSKVIYQKAIGKADIEKNIPNNTKTRYQLASLTKLLTKILVLQLINEKRLAFGDPLSKYIDGFGKKADEITIQHLLEHKAGFGSYYEVPSFEDKAGDIKSVKDFIPFIRQEELRFEPGAESAYSNSGFVLLAAIIEKASGKDYPTVLKEKIFDPLNMQSAGFSVRIPQEADIAKGYLTRELGAKKNNANMLYPAGGDGGIYMTVADFAKLDYSIFYDNILLPDGAKCYLFHNNAGSYPETWSPEKIRFAIGGGAPGISTIYCYLGDKKTSIIAFSNYDEGSSEELQRGLASIINGKTPKPLQPPLSKFLYNLLKTKGAVYFSNNVEKEMANNGYKLEDDMLLFFAGQQLLKEKKADEAIALYRFYTEKFPNIVVGWNDMGDAYLLKKNKAEAKKCYEKALELRPQNPRAKNSLEALKN